MTGYILIAAVLILGGVIATVGDRIGTRVGKKRLSLFNMRPKKTAVLVTILTGLGISASTLGILFLADKGLRDGVLRLDDIQKELRRKRRELNQQSQDLEATRKEKKQVEEQRNQASIEKQQAQVELQKIDKSLQIANTKQKETQSQLKRTLDQEAKTKNQLQQTQQQLGNVGVQYQQAISRLQSVNDERKKLQTEIAEQKAESQRLYEVAKKSIDEAKKAIQKRDQEIAKSQSVIESRDRQITELDQTIQKRNLEIASREQILAKRESRLKELETQQDYLEQEVARLDKYYQSFRDLRLGKLALLRSQVLASAVISVRKADAAKEGIIRLLEEANRNAVSVLTEPGSNKENIQLLQVTQKQIQDLSKQINDGKEYVVRVFSAGNYVRGEKRIEFFTDVALNQIVFVQNEVLATTTADPTKMTSYELRQRLDLLISASQFRARNAGILNDIQVESTFLRFIAQLRQYDQPVEIKAIAVEDTYTAGPLKVKLVGIQNGQIIFST
jgi:uncharacterized protein (DUF3084 family)